MHRTTIPLEGLVERDLRRISTQEKRSFKDLVNDLLKRGIRDYKSAKASRKLAFEWHTSDAKPNPAFDPSDRSTYLDVISRKVP